MEKLSIPLTRTIIRGIFSATIIFPSLFLNDIHKHKPLESLSGIYLKTLVCKMEYEQAEQLS